MLYKVVGFVNLLLGVLLMIFPLIIAFVILPSLTELYTKIGTAPSSGSICFSLGAAFLVGAVDLFLGFNLLKGPEESRERYLKYGVISALVSLILPGVLNATTILQVIYPLYNLSSQF